MGNTYEEEDIIYSSGKQLGSVAPSVAPEDRVVSSTFQIEDAVTEATIRPMTLADYTGQTKIKDNLQVFMAAAQKRGEALDHVLLYGPPGLGKTTLANIIANEMQVHIRTTSGPAIERTGDLAAILTSLEPRDVLFIDEIHRMSRVVEEVLYPAMEDHCIDIIIGKGPSARTLRLDLPPFTLIGATTRAGMLSSPLRDRFGMIFRLEYYNEQDLVEIISRAAKMLKVEMEPAGALEIARRSRGTPRIANRLLRRLRDFAQVNGEGIITKEIAQTGLKLLEVDGLGLDKIDQKVMLAILDKFAGGPVGLDTIAAAIGESSDTIEDVCEPYLMQLGFVNRTPRGRQATVEAYKYFNRKMPASRKKELEKAAKKESMASNSLFDGE
ncbi:MAG: Holliday junction branch migration DNA helicase RuvB [Peptococcaceae bacterium]|nr:Holliday junction branch migration DNA helicase RuvB [Peptococcaceae bacterium]